MNYIVAARHRHPIAAALVDSAFTFCANRPLLVVHVLILSLQALVLFTVPLCFLAYYSHIYMQTTFIPPRSIPVPLLLVPRRSADTTLVSPNERECDVDPHTRSLMTRSAYKFRIPRSVPYYRPLCPQSPLLYDGEWEYRVEGLIGSGTFGRVALATVMDTSPPVRVAIKVFSKERLRRGLTPHGMLENEQGILLENAKYKTRWLVQLISAFTDPWNYYLVMDYYPNTLAGVMFSYGNWLPDNILRRWVEELAIAMSELYGQGIVHCDLKPGNILVTADGHLAIADFGMSVSTDERKPLDQCVFFAYGGTYAYQAPELLIAHDKAEITCAVDMWSFGTIIYEMYTGKRLFSVDPSVVRNEVWCWDIPKIVRENIDDELAQELVIKLLDVDERTRLKMSGLMKLPYFAKTNVLEIFRKTSFVKIEASEPSSLSWRDALKFHRPTAVGLVGSRNYSYSH
ncbi:kinase-like domain-containing protein [Lactifluus volemus]|nr:kinase-like domain-containing protein [Lactifluus volemus]